MIFFGKCDQLTNSISIESELKEINSNFSRAKTAHTDADVTHVLNKARKSAEGDMTRIEKSSEKCKLRSTMSFWKLLLRDEEGENVDERKTQRRSDVVGIRWNPACTKSEIDFKVEEATEKME